MYEGFFMTKIFHPNVSEQGEICVNTLKKDWQPTLGLDHVLMVHFFSAMFAVSARLVIRPVRRSFDAS